MKKAILGGSFNPIHNAHLEMAKCVHEQLGLNDIIVMPNKSTYYKDNNLFVSDEHRLNMIKLAIEGVPYLSVSDMEIKRGGITHTIDTVREYLCEYPGIVLYFIIGGDSLEWIDHWYEAEELLRSVNILTAVRGETDIKRTLEIINILKVKHPESHIEMLNMPNINISSSSIRENIRNGISVKGLLDEKVIEYIKNNNLYI